MSIRVLCYFRTIVICVYYWYKIDVYSSIDNRLNSLCLQLHALRHSSNRRFVYATRLSDETVTGLPFATNDNDWTPISDKSEPKRQQSSCSESQCPGRDNRAWTCGKSRLGRNKRTLYKPSNIYSVPSVHGDGVTAYCLLTKEHPFILEIWNFTQWWVLNIFYMHTTAHTHTHTRTCMYIQIHFIFYFFNNN